MMLRLIQCYECGGLHYDNIVHHCPPKWLAIDAETLEETGDWSQAITVHSWHAVESAEVAARRLDEVYAEGPCDQTIHVKREDGTGDTETFRVTHEIRVDYYAHKQEPMSCDAPSPKVIGNRR